MKIYLLCIVAVLFALPSFADTYTWVDNQGTVNFTEDLGNVPAKYRNKVKVLSEEEPPPAEVNQGGEKPSAKVKPDAAREPRGEGAKAPGRDKAKMVYGGKTAETWKSEFGALDADLKASEKQLVETRNLVKDTSGMSRTDYLTIQNTLRAIENSVLMRRKKIEDLRREAEAAGVPTGLMDME